MFNLFKIALGLLVALPLSAAEGGIKRVLLPLSSEYNTIYISETSNIYSKSGLHDARVPTYGDIRVGKDIGVLIKNGGRWVLVTFPIVEILWKDGECKLMSESGYKENEKMIDVVYLKGCATN